MKNDIDSLDNYFINQDLPYIRPFYDVNLKEDNDVLQWFRDTDAELNNYYHPLFAEQKQNLMLFLGAGRNPKYLNADIADFINYNEDAATEGGVFVNELYRYTMDQVTLIISNELTPQVIPNNVEFTDKIAAKVTKQWLDSMNYDLDIDIKRVQWEIQKKIFGEAFVIPRWNPNKGDIHPAALEFMEEDIPYLDEDGKEVLDEDGKALMLRKNIRTGDIELCNPPPYQTLIDPQEKYENALWFYWTDYVDLCYLQKKYPDKMFKEGRKNYKVDNTTGKYANYRNKKKVYYFYHKSHEFLPFGRYVMCTEDVVLKNSPIKALDLLKSQKLPLVRFVDLDYGWGVRGTPILYRNISNLNDALNKLDNQIYNNLQIESPKIIVHEEAGFDGRRMPTGIVVFEWRGRVEPKIVTPTTNTSSIFKYREDLKKNLDEMARQTPMVRGDVPNSQIDSFVAFQYFEDLRVQLAANDIKSHIHSMEDLYRLLIVLGRANLDKDEHRLIKIMGKNNQFQLRYFDPENLLKSYDVKITTTGNLANTKAARNQMLITIKREFGHLVQDETFVDMLGLSHTEKLMTAVTTAVNTAEAENADMMNDISVAPPERYEDLIVHWDAHRIPIQSLDYKMAPDGVKLKFEKHIAATEKLMFEEAAESPTFQQRLMELKQFPLFYSPTPTNLAPDMPPSDPLEQPGVQSPPVELAESLQGGTNEIQEQPQRQYA